MSKVVSGHIYKIAIFRIFKRKTALFSDTISRNTLLCASCPQILPRFPLSLAAYPSYMPPLRTFPPLLSGINVCIYIYFYITLFFHLVCTGCSSRRSGSMCGPLPFGSSQRLPARPDLSGRPLIRAPVPPSGLARMKYPVGGGPHPSAYPCGVFSH